MTHLGISAPNFIVDISPSPASGQYTSGFAYVSITGDGIKSNSSGIWTNGSYLFSYYRGTGPFITGAAYSPTNLRTRLETIQTIDWLDNVVPSFAGASEGAHYTTAISITFTDNLPGVTATLNGNPFAYGGLIDSDGIYQLLITDAVGNTTGTTFTVTIAGSIAPGSDSGGGGGGGGFDIGARLLIQSVCSNRNCYSNYYANICGPCIPTISSGVNSGYPSLPLQPNIASSSYPKERNDAYQWGYRLGIINAPDITTADLTGSLYRKIAAKMASEFAIKIIGLKPDTSKSCVFSDIKKEPLELQYYIKLSCQLGIMGLDYYGNPVTTFNPNYIVTRSQFVTILSRILFGGKYNLATKELSFFDKTKNFVIHTLNNIGEALHLNLDLYSSLEWYTKHMEIIKKLDVMTDYTPTLKEVKIYILLIMYRLDQLGITEVQSIN